MRQSEKALREIQMAHQLDPLSLSILGSYGEVYLYLGEYDLAIAKYNMALELDPNFRSSWEGKGWVYSKSGDLDSALESFKTYQKMTGSELKGLTGLAHTYIKLRQDDKARECLNKMELRKKQDGGVDLSIDFAIVYGAMGEWDKVCEYMDLGVKQNIGTPFLIAHPMWDDFRKTEGFRLLAKKHRLRLGQTE